MGKLDDPFPPGIQEMKLSDRETKLPEFATRKTVATVWILIISDLQTTATTPAGLSNATAAPNALFAAGYARFLRNSATLNSMKNVQTAKAILHCSNENWIETIALYPKNPCRKLDCCAGFVPTKKPRLSPGLLLATKTP